MRFVGCMFKTEEYQALLTAQRQMLKVLSGNAEDRDKVMAASALTRIVDQKRVMRGQPAPKPETGLRRYRSGKPIVVAGPSFDEPSASAATG